MEGAAQKLGAVDSTPRSVVDAARNRDIVVLALPYSEVQAAYRVIGSELRPGAVVLDLSPLKLPSIKWAEAHLPETAYMVGATPILNPKYLFDGLDDVDHAAADLFDGGTFLLMPATNAPKDAVELATDFAERLSTMGKPAWVRFTLVPGHTDDPANVEGIAKFVAPMKNVEWVEVQPFHQMGEFKWKAMGLPYVHETTARPTPDLISRVIGQFRSAGCNVR